METKIEELEKEVKELVEEVKVKPEPPKPITKPKKIRKIKSKPKPKPVPKPRVELEAEKKRKSVYGLGKAINKKPFEGPARDKKILLQIRRVCYNCLSYKERICNKWKFKVRPDNHCFKYQKGVRVDGRSRF